MITWNLSRNIGIIGKEGQAGTYSLLIKLNRDKKLIFGRFKKGKQIFLQKGFYLYIGSALHPNGATSLGNRLIRHSKRSMNQEAHKIQTNLLKIFDDLGIVYSKSNTTKKLFWNIDHLLDLKEAEILGIICTRNSIPLENSWSKFFEHKKETIIFEKGLGANDSVGHTHIQFVDSKQIGLNQRNNHINILTWWKGIGTELEKV